MRLKEYKAKRDFRRTAEPVGGRAPRAKDHSLSFVVQKHAASHLHYDFRLEMDGVLKSWAVPKGVPVKRGDRRLAVEVEDHPLEYGSFEGTIAEGNYGAGTVMLWDCGTYRVFGDDPLKALEQGKIHFSLNGKKLKGEWTLVRMRHAEGAKPQWLLLKTGEDLPELHASADDRSVSSGRSMSQIAGAKVAREWQSNRQTRSRPPTLADEDFRHSRSGSPPLRVGSVRSRRRFPKPARTRTSPAAAARTTPDPAIDMKSLPLGRARFLEPMKALLVESLPKGQEWLYEIKFDGVRALAVKNGKSVLLISRSCKDLGGKYSDVVKAVKNLDVKQAVFDGEIVAVDEQGRSAFQLLQSYQTSAAKPPLFYYVFDLLHLNGRDLTSVPLWQRKTIAQSLIDEANPSVRFSNSIQAGSARLIKAMQARGLEGLIAKKRESRYEPGRRSGAWVKFKWTNEQEFVIGGYTKPKGARSHFGAILVGFYERDKLRFAAKVGTGFNEATLHLLYEKFQKLEQPECPFINLPERGSGLISGLGPAEMRRCTWIRPELVCQVRFAEWTRDHHLRQPAYLGLREDKHPREVVREKPA